MRTHHKRLALSALALAVLGAALSMAPVQDLGSRTLFGCAVDVRPAGQLEITVKGTSTYDEPNQMVTTEIQLWVPDTIAAQVGDYDGNNLQGLNQNAVNTVTLVYDVDDNEMILSVNGMNPQALETIGTFNEEEPALWMAKQQMRNISPTQRRCRLRLDIFGIGTGFVLRDV